MMDEEQLKALPDDQFFKLFIEAVKNTYEEYRIFKAEDEGILTYREPVFEAAMDDFENRLNNIKS